VFLDDGLYLTRKIDTLRRGTRLRWCGPEGTDENHDPEGRGQYDEAGGSSHVPRPCASI
jgi:hypothetical protein